MKEACERTEATRIKVVPPKSRGGKKRWAGEAIITIIRIMWGVGLHSSNSADGAACEDMYH